MALDFEQGIETFASEICGRLSCDDERQRTNNRTPRSEASGIHLQPRLVE
jgi:hypothetical protein